jgi:histidinol-phosphatase (PHP family)
MALQADMHVHSEFSWDTGGPDSAARGRMLATCRRAAAIGLPALCFTEHLDLGTWLAEPEDLMPHQRHLLTDGVVRVPPLDVPRWREAVEDCRRAVPDLVILTGVEFGQPHLFDAEARALLDLDALDRVNGSLHTLDRVNGSLHTLPLNGSRAEPVTLYRHLPPDEVVRAYLAEVPAMAAGSDAVEVVTHLDYAVRTWPAETAGPFDPRRFEEEIRGAMRAIAGTGRALELNTSRLHSWTPQWWAEEGGRSVAFGSDAHVPERLAFELPEAAALAEAFGFRPGRRPWDLWTR